MWGLHFQDHKEIASLTLGLIRKVPFIWSGLPNIASFWLTGSWWIANLITRLKSYSQALPQVGEEAHWRSSVLGIWRLSLLQSVGHFPIPGLCNCWVSEGTQVLSTRRWLLLLRAFISFSLFEDVSLTWCMRHAFIIKQCHGQHSFCGTAPLAIGTCHLVWYTWKTV